ncbi:MAG TPA: PKD domain-containing protein [Solirubrobacteraceae bacterium]|nr:PKD domain-containing protein [Solirubrobacteraceae bacterium]
MVAWLAEFSTSPSVEVARRPAGGAFLPAEPISGAGITREPVVAMDAKGDATVSWVSFDGGYGTIEAASCPAEAECGDPVALSASSVNAEMPAIAMDPQGDATIAWVLNRLLPAPEPPYPIEMAIQPAGGGFGLPTGFLLDRDSHPAVAMDAYGNTTIVWVRYEEESETEYIDASTRMATSGTFEKPVVLYSAKALETEVSEIQPKVAVDAAGDTTIVWGSPKAGMKVMTRQSGAFSKPIELESPSSGGSPPAIAMDDKGDGAVVWVGKAEPGDFPLGSTMPAGGMFGTPVFLMNIGDLSVPENSESPVTLAMDTQGNAVSAWVSSNGERDTVQVAGYQASGPQLEALQAPTEGQAGAPLAFSASPLSVWSTIASTTWSWGDGSPDTSGTDVAHVFNAPGTYQVSVSATDALGNTTNATRTIIIIHAPLTLNINPTLTNNPKTSPTPPKSKLKAKEAVVSLFTPLFATRASTGGSSLGLLVGIPAVKGARAGDTIVVRCTAGCQRPVRMTIHVRKHHARDVLTISPPLSVYRTTRIEIELLAPGHVARFVQYQFVRTGNALIAHPTHRGCLSLAGRPRSCP